MCYLLSYNPYHSGGYPPMNYKVNDNAQRSQTKPKKNHFCYIYNKVYGVGDRKPQLIKPSSSLPREGTEKLKPTIKLKVDDGEIAVLPFIICLF